MSFLPRALALAEKGYFVFPAQENKRPAVGFMDWEAQASRDAETLRKWWNIYPESLPAVAPGRSGLAVIDVDRHGEEQDGFVSLKAEGIVVEDDWVSGVSLSGKGQHLWFRHDITSRNRVLLGVDRKAQGGYVIVPYELPDAESIITPLPEKLALNPLFNSLARTRMSLDALDEWLATVGGGPLSEPMYSVLATFKGTGNSQMSSSIARVVSFAAKGFSGAAKALEKMREIWEDGTHYSGDPTAEFMANVRSAIEKFGRPVSDDSADQFYAMLRENDTVTVSFASLLDSMLLYCDRLDRDWRDDAEWVRLFRLCQDAMSQIASVEDVDRWRTTTKLIMDKMLERHNEQKTD